MLKKLNPYFKKIGSKRFYLLAPALSFFADIALIFYISKYMLPKLINHQFILLIFKAKGLSAHQLTSQDSLMFQNILSSSLSLAFVFIIFFNLLIYILGMKKFKWAIKYITGYCLSAALLSIFELASYIYSGSGVNLITLLTMVIYYIVYAGYAYFKKTEE